MQPKKFSEYTPITETDGSEVIPILKAGVNATVKSEDLPISTATQTAIDAADADIAAHIADVANPHSVTKAQVGLGNADNTSDANKPVSTAQATAIALKADTTYVDSQDALKADQSTTYTKTEVDTKDTAVADTAQTNLTAHTSNTSNPHATTKSQVGLANADNTSDVDKPISAATQTALDAKATNTALDAHTNNTSNPHSVTKAQVGLGNADNTSDANKPVSTAQATADAAVASTAASNLATHTSNTSNPHATTKAQVGLSNVDNTSDANKPVSTAQAAANALKVNKAGDTMTGPLETTNITALGGNAAYNGGYPTYTLNNGSKKWDLYETGDGSMIFKNTTDNLAPIIIRANTPQSMLELYGGGVQLLSNFIPRADNTGSIGTSLFKFSDVQTKKVTVDGANIVSGTGFPEGVISAPVGSIYKDKNATNGVTSWEKLKGTSSTGWNPTQAEWVLIHDVSISTATNSPAPFSVPLPSGYRGIKVVASLTKSTATGDLGIYFVDGSSADILCDYRRYYDSGTSRVSSVASTQSSAATLSSVAAGAMVTFECQWNEAGGSAWDTYRASATLYSGTASTEELFVGWQRSATKPALLQIRQSAGQIAAGARLQIFVNKEI